jgi:hypothetical protein
VWIQVRGKNCQDDGNQRNKGDVDIHERTVVKLLIGTAPVNLSFQFMTLAAQLWHSDHCYSKAL